MRAVAYCRVSTNKEEQLDSLESQQKFFQDYALKNGYDLIHTYADEGKSGTKIKNRKQLLQLLEDAQKNSYETVLIKDISRLARNTVDFLTSIRRLKALNIKVVFVNYDHTSSESSEFMLTMLSAIAQEESANTSKRVRFGKKQNAELGRVPNLVYGYDKIPGDYFNLKINQNEKEVVKYIYEMYTEDNMGTGAIAEKLNKQGIKTKRGCLFTQTAIRRILSNEIYTGNIINGKEEVADFLTGERRAKEEDQWMVIKRPELIIVKEETYLKAKSLLESRRNTFLKEGKKQHSKYIFSGLFICKECGSTFRRITRTYKNTYHKWACATRNLKGKSACLNSCTVNENELTKEIINYMIDILSEHSHITKKILQDYYLQKRRVNHGGTDQVYGVNKRIEKLKVAKHKHIELFTNDIISIEELKISIQALDKKINMEQIRLAAYKNIVDDIDDNNNLTEQSEVMEDIIKKYLLVNAPLRRFIQRIEVDKNRNINIYINELAK